MANDEWRTPPALFEVLSHRYAFTIDAAATTDNALVPLFISEEENALKVPWGRSVSDVAFCNPPYSSGNIPTFLRRGIEQIDAGRIGEAVFLIRADVSTRYWHELVIARADEVLFPNGRVNFLTAAGETDRGSGTNGARSPNFASAVVVFRCRTPGISLPINYGVIEYDRGKRQMRDDSLPGSTPYRRP